MKTQARSENLLTADAAVYWHFSMSFNCHKTSVALAEAGLVVKEEVVDLLAAQQLGPSYMAINPKGLVPCLQLPSGETLVDSADIITYLAEHVTNRIALLPPAGSEARKTAEAWFARGRELPMERLTFARKALPGGPGLIDLRIATIRECLADPETPQKLIPHYQRRLNGYLASGKGSRSRGEAEYTDAIREALASEVRVVLDELEALLASDARPFIAGNAYSIAECMWTAILARLSLVGLAGWWTGNQRPAVRTYFDRLRGRPSYAAAGVIHERVRRPE